MIPNFQRRGKGSTRLGDWPRVTQLGNNRPVVPTKSPDSKSSPSAALPKHETETTPGTLSALSP